jgi:DNA-binding NarL/FixJ family response regulator
MTTKSSNHSEKNSALIQVVVACYYPLLREGISKIIEDDNNIEIVHRVSNLLDLVQVCEEFKFDVLLLDIDLRGINLTKILQLLKKNKNAKVILIVDNDYNENTLISAIRSGVRGYLLKNTESKHLTKAIKSVNDGELWVERKMMVKVLEAFSSSPKMKDKKRKSAVYELTETETKIVKLVLNGLSNRDIAKDLYISEKTVKFHLYKIFKKLSVKNRSALILYGFRNGFVS